MTMVVSVFIVIDRADMSQVDALPTLIPYRLDKFTQREGLIITPSMKMKPFPSPKI